MRGQDYHGDGAQLGVLPLEGPELPAIHDWHHDVEQDHARLVRAGTESLDRFLTVRGADGPILVVLEDFCDGLAHIAIVLDDHHEVVTDLVVHGCDSARSALVESASTACLGTSMTNVDPRSSLLATWIEPPWASTMFRVM